MRGNCRAFLLSLLCLSLAAGQPYAQPLQAAPATLEQIARTYTTPKALAQFLRRHVRFANDQDLFDEVDHWQAPEEFLARQAGDCEDYALFAQAVLRRQGIEAEVLSLFGAEGYAHTVCVFKEGARRYRVLNQHRLRTYRADTLEQLAGQLYPSWTYAARALLARERGEAVTTFTNSRPLDPHWAADAWGSF